jgi:hypothetical protein
MVPSSVVRMALTRAYQQTLRMPLPMIAARSRLQKGVEILPRQVFPKIDHDHAQAVVACASWADKLSSITLTLLEPMIS